MANDSAGLQAAILSALADGPRSISEIEAHTGAKRSACLSALRTLRAAGSVELQGAKRGAKYALGTRPAV